MPRASKYPRLRLHVKRGKAGQCWQSWWFDMRGTGKPDIPLGNNYEIAKARWAELYYDAPRIAGTLEEAFREWEARGLHVSLNGKPRSAETVSGYVKALRALRPVFKSARWDEVTLPALRKYSQERSAPGRAKHELRLLSVIWGWARVEGFTALPYPAAGMSRTGWMGANNARDVKVTDAQFDTIYKHADQVLRDALDIATATGLRVMDVIGLRLSDVRDGFLVVTQRKTKKTKDFDLATSAVVPPIIERRRAYKKAEHLFLLADGKKPITYRRLNDRFVAARAEAAEELPECAGVWLRDMRKRAAALTASLEEAAELLDHADKATTAKHYLSKQRKKMAR